MFDFDSLFKMPDFSMPDFALPGEGFSDKGLSAPEAPLGLSGFTRSPLLEGLTKETRELLKTQEKIKAEAYSPEIMKILEEERKALEEAGVDVWEVQDALQRDLMERAAIEASLIHETLNIYAMMGIKAPYLEATWFAFREDGMDDILEKAGNSLDKSMFERLNIRPVIVSDESAEGKERLFLARFELPKYGQTPVYEEAILPMANYKCLGWIDLLAGFQYGCCEMLMVVGEVTTRTEEFPAQPGENGPVPPVPDDFFDEKFKEDKIVHNHLWLESENAEGLVEGLSSEPVPEGPHWFFRVNCIETQKWPYPGEFVGLGNRIFPNLPWTLATRSPEYHPFLFSGSYLDTVFITSAEVIDTEITAAGYCKVKVRWREKEIWAYPTDFAQYEVGDRVTICKDVTTTKTSELWKDPDLWSFDEEIWRVAPITYYNKGLSW
jgi:hypothetical protein